MHRIDTPSAAAGNLFTNGNPSLNILATEVDADWLNTQQEEIANVVEGEGIALSRVQNDQLRVAILSMIARLGPAGDRYVNADTVMTAGTYLVDSSAGSFNLTLPAAPNTPTRIRLVDLRGTWDDNPVTLLRNGHPIMDLNEDMLLHVCGLEFSIWFDSANNTWRLV